MLSAHLDHLGIGGAINGDRVYNGAMDNASGVATLIETARALSNKKLKRTILFAAVTGEEGGLMGSKYFAAHPTIPASNIAADVNLDMFLPIIPLKAITVFGMDESDLGREFAETASKFGVKAERDSEPARNLFIRSDQYSFIRRGIPAVTFKFYAPTGSPESKILRFGAVQRYHAPSDDVKQPVEVEAAAEFNQIIAAFIEELRTMRRVHNGSRRASSAGIPWLTNTYNMPNLNVFSLEGKTALVAGASRGIGLAIAQHIARAGAHTILASRSMDKLEANAKELRDHGFSAEAARGRYFGSRLNRRICRCASAGRYPDQCFRHERPQTIRRVHR